MITIAEKFGLGVHPEYVQTKTFFAGLECEMEQVLGAPQNISIFEGKQDGSLREGGVEFVSTPAQLDQLCKGFQNLHATLKFSGSDPFSVRTSTHVHVNCQGMTLVQARNMVLLYALFEEFFFGMVKPDRRDNIHCVPLTETYLPGIYKNDFNYYITKWHKYTALNLKRITDLGTMEFRHLHGTKDPVEVKQWLQTLRNLWKTALDAQLNAVTLNNDQITKWFASVFADAPKQLERQPVLFNIIHNNLIDVKLSV